MIGSPSGEIEQATVARTTGSTPGGVSKPGPQVSNSGLGTRDSSNSSGSTVAVARGDGVEALTVDRGTVNVGRAVATGGSEMPFRGVPFVGGELGIEPEHPASNITAAMAAARRFGTLKGS